MADRRKPTSVDGMWNPDKHSIVMRLGADDLICCSCLCGADARVAHWDDVQAWCGNHRCPPGAVGAWPTCPTCGATGRACLTGDGRGFARRPWCAARLDLFVAVTGHLPNLPAPVGAA